MGSNSAGWTGYNPEQMRNTYEICTKNLCTIIDDMNIGSQHILDMIGTHWAAPEAVEFSESLAKDMQTFLNKVLNESKNIVTTIKNAADRWDATTGGNLNLPNKTGIILSYQHQVQSKAVNDINGIVGADVDIITGPEFWLELDNSSAGIKDNMDKFKINAQEFGFVGSNQMSSLINSLEHLCKAQTNMYSNVENAVKKEVQKAAQKYRDTAGEIGQSFSNIG